MGNGGASGQSAVGPGRVACFDARCAAVIQHVAAIAAALARARPTIALTIAKLLRSCLRGRADCVGAKTDPR
eukprot:7381046-Prymnesium_polylepis.3